MNNQQQQFFDYILSKANLLDLPKIKDILKESFEKQTKGEMNAEYLTQLAPKLLACIKDDAKQEVANVLEDFKKNFK